MSDPVVDVRELVEAASLTTITATRLHCHRDLDVEASEDFEISPEYELNIGTRADAAGFRILVRTSIDVPIGQISCDVAAEYELDGIVLGEGSSQAMQEFVNNVALMHILPYARQAIADLTQRVFSAPLLMPIMKRGELEFQVGED